MNISIYTLGCKVNQYETQAMEAALLARGHNLVPFDAAADAYLINTCSVTAVSDKKSRQMIRKARRQNPEAIVAVCGCFSQTHPEEAKKLPVDLVFGTGSRMACIDALEQVYRSRSPVYQVDDAFSHRTFERLPAGSLEGRARAMLKVEDGCVNFCSYCIIPYARGPVRSLPVEDAVAEARRLQAEGFRELVLTGIEISSYGGEAAGGSKLIDLMEALAQAVGDTMRLRLGSLEPRTITEDFCRRASALPCLCPHFHLSLQSGCDATLARMKRKYDTARYLESVSLLRRFFQAPAITTDLIVGFPGETEAEFAQTLDFLRVCGFSAVHVFPYSRRPGTPAAQMDGQIPQAEKERRAAKAAQVAEELQQSYLQAQADRTLHVLIERTEDGVSRGHSENYLEVLVQTPETRDCRREILPVRITGVSGQRLLGTAE
jgi:threonylcarbamoyladenosine tRNA methylthiotransferase MtaB